MFEDFDIGDEVCDDNESIENKNIDDVFINGGKVFCLQSFMKSDENILPFNPHLFLNNNSSILTANYYPVNTSHVELKFSITFLYGNIFMFVG